MATIIRQTTIWQELERELPPGLKQVEDFLSILNEFDDELVRDLIAERGHGRDDHPVPAMWNFLSVGLYLRQGKFSELLGELNRNSDLARLLGFEEIGPNCYRIPSDSALSRFHVKLKSDTYMPKVEAVFKRTVAALSAVDPEFGKHSALDASDVRTHARPGSKVKEEATAGGNEKGDKLENEQKLERQEDKGDKDEKDEKKRKPSSDPEASWSVKTKIRQDAQGKPRKENECTFGYKLYAVVDTNIPAVAAVDVQTGKTSDQNMAMPMLDAAKENLGENRIETVAMDKGFDSEENVREAKSKGVAAIIPVREVPENLEKLPPQDREEPLSPGSNVVYDRYTGEVFCYEPSSNANEPPTRRPMIYAGFESDRETHKFRCPLGGCAASACKAFKTCAAGSSGSQGKQARIPMSTDYRRFAPVYPRSKRWKRLYNGRSAVERINSYLKEVLQLERHCLRGKNSIKLRVLVASITLNVRTLMKLRAVQAQSQAA